jgi:hypothetical protein
MKKIDLGKDETVVEFEISGNKFQCFPAEEIDIINDIAEAKTGSKDASGEALCVVIQSRLSDRYGISASLGMSARWYNALDAAAREQDDFFAESPASSGPTGSSPVAGEKQSGELSDSAKMSSTSSSELSTQSEPKKSQKRSSRQKKTQNQDGEI